MFGDLDHQNDGSICQRAVLDDHNTTLDIEHELQKHYF